MLTTAGACFIIGLLFGGPSFPKDGARFVPNREHPQVCRSGRWVATDEEICFYRLGSEACLRIPTTTGWHRLWMRWGSKIAHLDGHPINVIVILKNVA